MSVSAAPPLAVPNAARVSSAVPVRLYLIAVTLASTLVIVGLLFLIGRAKSVWRA